LGFTSGFAAVGSGAFAEGMSVATASSVLGACSSATLGACFSTVLGATSPASLWLVLPLLGSILSFYLWDLCVKQALLSTTGNCWDNADFIAFFVYLCLLKPDIFVDV